jgi:alanyl aminopeptidase
MITTLFKTGLGGVKRMNRYLPTRQLFALALTLIAFCASAMAADQPPKLRLSEVQNIQPVSYRAELTLDPAKDDFTGSILIRMDIKQPVQTIWLEQEKITVRRASLTAGGKTMMPKTLSGGDDFVGFQFDSPAPAGPAEFKIDYSGTVITKNSAAVFRQQDNGNWYIFSQFEPADARGAFPCFDEPSYKTPWQLTLHFPAVDNAISNTAPGSDRVEGAMRTVVFHETKPLPSYLVAFAVGPFEYVPAGFTAMKHVPVRIVVPKGHTAEAQYAAQVTAGIINHHERYFGIPFPYEKADQVAVPDTSGWGAMENPGMVTYAQTILLARPQDDTIGRRRGYFTVAAHELAHQWFGDLVTTAWWDDIWLNEAFATWFEQKTTSEMHPEWKTETDDVDSKFFAMSQDSLITARKIRQPIETKDDINDAFDGITYQKGAAVIGMFERWMGTAQFQKGIQAYIKQFSWRAVTADDFLDSLGTASRKEISKPFSTFLNQSGIPMVSVSMMCEAGAATLHLEQQRFLPLGSQGSADQLWSIPFCIRSPDGLNECTLLTSKTLDMMLKTRSCPAWLEANSNGAGYYRVDYQGNLLAKLIEGDVEQRLNAPERVDLMGNAQALSVAGRLPAGDALSLVSTFGSDKERDVVLNAVDLALVPRTYLVPQNLDANYKRFLLKNFQSRAHELGWTPKPGESEDAKLLRPRLVRLVATDGGDRSFAEEAQTLAQKWLDDHNTIDPNMTDAVLATASYYGDKALFDRFLAEFQKTDDKQIRQRLVGAMGSFRDAAAIKAGMNAVIEGKVPFIEGAFLLFNGQSDASTRKLAFEFLQSNWDKITSQMPSGGGFDFGSVLPQVGAGYCDANSRDELSAFFKPRVDKFVGAPRALDQVIEGINLCIARVAAQKPSVEAFLQKY